MRSSRLIVPMGVLLGVLLIGCGQGQRKQTDNGVSQGPNYVSLKVAGMT